MRARLPFLAAIAMSALPVVAAAGPADACEKLARGGSHAKALECYKKVYDANPADHEAGNAYAALLAERGEYPKAVATFDKVLAKDPKNSIARNGKAMSLLVLKKYEEAFNILEAALLDDPKNVQTLQNCGILALLTNKLDIAAGAFQRVLAIDAGHAGAHSGLGETAMLLGKMDIAQEHFLAAIGKNDKDSRSHWLLGKVLSRSNPRLAVDYLERASFLAPKDADVWYDLGITRRMIGESRLAGQALTQAQALAPSDPKIFLELGKVHTDMNRFDMAAAHFDKALTLKPDPATKAQVHFHYGLLFETQAEYKKAEAQYLQSLRSRPDDLSTMLNLSRLYAGQKRWQDARGILDKAAKQDPSNVAVRYNLGAVMIQQGDVEAGKQELRNVIAGLKADDPMRGQAEEILRGAKPGLIPPNTATKKP